MPALTVRPFSNAQLISTSTGNIELLVIALAAFTAQRRPIISIFICQLLEAVWVYDIINRRLDTCERSDACERS
jgi:hypothetical protein